MCRLHEMRVCVPRCRNAFFFLADASQPVTVRRPSQAGATPDARCTIASHVQGPVKGGTRLRGRVLESDTQVRMQYCLPVCPYCSTALMGAGAQSGAVRLTQSCLELVDTGPMHGVSRIAALIAMMLSEGRVCKPHYGSMGRRLHAPRRKSLRCSEWARCSGKGSSARRGCVRRGPPESCTPANPSPNGSCCE